MEVGICIHVCSNLKAERMRGLLSFRHLHLSFEYVHARVEEMQGALRSRSSQLAGRVPDTGSPVRGGGAGQEVGC